MCQNPDNEFAFTVPPPNRCHASSALFAAQARVTEETNPQHEALLWGVHLSERGV